MFIWNQQTINDRLNLAKNTDFYQVITNEIIHQFPNSSDLTFCDAGCGLGSLSLLLSPYVKNITALDINKKVLSYFKKEINKNNINNINIKQKDLLKKYNTGNFDVIIFSFFSNIKEILLQFNKKNKYKNIIFVCKNKDDKNNEIHNALKNLQMSHNRVVYYSKEYDYNILIYNIYNYV